MSNSNASGAQAAGEAPAGWVRVVEPWAGYALAHPPGWAVHNERGTLVISENASKTAAAFIAAAPLAGAANVQDFATRYVAAIRAGDASFEAVPIADSTPSPDKLLLRTRCRRGALALEGRINLVARGDQVVIRGFHAPADGTAADAPPCAAELLAILNSFRTFAAPPRQLFREPQEGAFAALVPTGWIASGKVARNAWTGATVCEFAAQSDPRGLTRVCVPGSFWQFNDSWLGTRFMPAGKFAAEWLPKNLPMQGLRVETSEPWPELMPRLQEDVAKLGVDPRTVEITAARTTGTFALAGTTLRARLFTATVRKPQAAWGDPLAGQWFALLPYYYHAPEGELDAVDAVLAGIARSFRIDPGWQQRQLAQAAQQQMMANMMLQQTMAQNRQAQQNFMNAQHHIWANQGQVSDGIMQSWQYHNAAQDHAMQQWSNATLGVTDVTNPATGTAYRVDNSFERYWAANDGTIFGGNWGTQPDPSWHALEPIKL